MKQKTTKQPLEDSKELRHVSTYGRYPEIRGILDRKRKGIDCDEFESRAIKTWVKHEILAVGNGSIELDEEIQELLPLEWGEAQDELGNIDEHGKLKEMGLIKLYSPTPDSKEGLQQPLEDNHHPDCPANDGFGCHCDELGSGSKEGLHTQGGKWVASDVAIEIFIGADALDYPPPVICRKPSDSSNAEWKANAELIVKAVNERKGLPELLKKIYHAIDIRCFSETENVSMTAIREELVKLGANEKDLW